MKFIHIADLHLDRSFEGLGQVSKQLLTELSQLNQQLLNNLVDCAIAEKVDFVLIAGDTFHQPIVTIQTQINFMRAMTRLEENQIPVVMSFGNHDYFLPEKYWFDFPKNIHLFKSETVETIELMTRAGESVSISGFSYNQRWLKDSKVGEFPARKKESTYHLGMYHGEQGLAHEQGYAPFKLSELVAKDYDYWALGHIHQRQVLQREPLIIYPGTPLGHSKKEKDETGFLLVELNGKVANYQWQEQHLIQWLSFSLEVDAELNQKEILTVLKEKILAAEETTATLSLLEVNLVITPSQLANIGQLTTWNRDVLIYLQETVFKASQEKIWPYRLKIKVKAGQEELPFGVSYDVLKQLSEQYLAPEAFNAMAEDLYRQRELRQLLSPTEEFRQQQIQSAQTLLLQKLGFENEEQK